MAEDIAAFESEMNMYTVKEIRFALHQVDKHPLRGEEKSNDASTGDGKVKDGQPTPGVRVIDDGDRIHFQITEVSGDHYGWDRFTMTPGSFTGFAAAMHDLLRKNR
jgi:hypothetical protein